MKESWIEKEIELNIKLHNLFKEYIENYGNDAKVREEENYILDTWIEFVYWSRVYLYETIISKKFWFIKRLVENDKIEFREDFYLEDQHWWWFGEDEDIIMLLAIQDEPIRFLCEILK